MDVRAAVACEPGKPVAVTHVTRQMPLTDSNKAFHLMHAGKSIRSVVTF